MLEMQLPTFAFAPVGEKNLTPLTAFFYVRHPIATRYNTLKNTCPSLCQA